MSPYWESSVDVLESGVLDDLNAEQIRLFSEDAGGGRVLVTRLRDGSSQRVTEAFIHTRLQACIDKLVYRGAGVILLQCTGSMPASLRSPVPLIYPQKILHAAIPAICGHERVAVVVPDTAQIGHARDRWTRTGLRVELHSASPYPERSDADHTDQLDTAIAAIKTSDASWVVLDCMGYPESVKHRVIQETGRKVVLARTLVARLTGELL